MTPAPVTAPVRLLCISSVSSGPAERLELAGKEERAVSSCAIERVSVDVVMRTQVRAGDEQVLELCRSRRYAEGSSGDATGRAALADRPWQ